MNSVKITSSYDTLFVFLTLFTRILYYFLVACQKLTMNNISIFVVGESAFFVLLLSFVRVHELSDQRDILALLCGYNVLKCMLNFGHLKCIWLQLISALSIVLAVIIVFVVDQETRDPAARICSWLQLLSWAFVDLS